MPNTNFQTIHQMDGAINSFVKQATGRDAVQNIDMEHITVAQNHYYEDVDISGRVVSFNAGAVGIPLEKCLVQIEPVQDLHGYDHPWPAGGGKNKLPNENGAYKGTTGNNINVVESESPVLLPAGTYYIKYFADKSTGLALAGFYLSINGGTASRIGNNHATQETVESFVLDEQSNITLRLYSSTNGFNEAKYRFMLTVEDSTNIAFSPYSNICPISGWNKAKVFVSPTTDEADGTTYIIAFPSEAGTVYGGKLDVTTGELVVDRAEVNLGDLSWDVMTGNRFKFTLPNGKVTGYYGQIVLCSCYGTRASNPASMNDYEYCCGSTYYNGSECWLIIKDSRYSSTSDFKTAMVGQQLCYKLATPVTYQLTPQEVRTLLGLNNIWADTGDIEVKFKNIKEFF